MMLFQAKSRWFTAIGVGLLLIPFGVLLYIHLSDEIQERDKPSQLYYTASFDSHIVAQPFVQPANSLTSSNLTDVTLHFRLKPYQLFSYEDIFQTADQNLGLRMELATPSSLSIVIGSRDLPGWKSFVISRNIKANQWYDILVHWEYGKSLRVTLDQKRVLDILDESFQPEISKVAVGNGFSTTRPFDGSIEGFQLNWSSRPEPAFLHAISVIVLARWVALLGAGALFIGLMLQFTFLCIENGTGLDSAYKTDLVTLIILLGFFIGVAYHYVLSAYLQHPYPANTFLELPSQFFGDFKILYQLNQNANPYFNPVVASNQYPLLNGIFVLFSKLPYCVALAFYLLASLIPLLVIAWSLIRGSNCFNRSKSVFVFVFLSYPMLFALDRGNVETLVFGCFLVSIVAFQRKSHKIAGFFAGTAIALKLFPGVLLFLFAANKDWKSIRMAMATAVVSTLAATALFSGSLISNLLFLVHGNNLNNYFLNLWLGPTNFVQRGVSLFTGLKMLLILNGHISQINMTLVLHWYFVLACSLAAGLIAFAIWWEDVLWKQIAILFCAMILCPHISADYKLVHLLIPCLLFISQPAQSPFDCWYAILFGFLLIPKDYHCFSSIVSETSISDISIAIPINIALLVILCSSIIYERTHRAKSLCDGTLKTQ